MLPSDVGRDGFVVGVEDVASQRVVQGRGEDGGLLVIGCIEYVRLKVTVAVGLGSREAVGEYALLAVWAVVAQLHSDGGHKLVYVFEFVTIAFQAVGDIIDAAIDYFLAGLVDVSIEADGQVVTFFVESFGVVASEKTKQRVEMLRLVLIVDVQCRGRKEMLALHPQRGLDIVCAGAQVAPEVDVAGAVDGIVEAHKYGAHIVAGSIV